MSVYGNIYRKHNSRGFGYNARFSYGDRSFDVNATNVQYSWDLAMSGSSQARQRQTNYPKRVEQSAITVSLVFRDPEEYRSFVEWVRLYHLTVTSQPDPPRMTFSSLDRSRGASWRYVVAIPKVQASFSYDMSPAPQMVGLRLDLLRDELDLTNPDSSDVVGGELVDDPVKKGDVAARGDRAFSKR